MKSLLFIVMVLTMVTVKVEALLVTEVFSNPVGDDNGREWIEIYNDTGVDVDISTLSFSIKGGTPISSTIVSGGVLLSPQSYAIVGSTVSGATKFALDHPTYTGILIKSGISLVNSGVTSLDVRISGVVADTISSYTAAKEGFSYGRQSTGSFKVISPTPGKENTILSQEEILETVPAPTSGTQTTIPQMSPPLADIVIYLPHEKIVVAGAPTLFSVAALSQAGKAIDSLRCNWTFGDGGVGVGSSTVYSYFYPGRYLAYVDVSNGLLAGKARMLVKVVAPEISLSPIKKSKHGLYLELYNPNAYELDISTWKLSIDGSQYTFPINTILLPGSTVISGVSLGFASTSVNSFSIVRLLFPNNEEVAKVEGGFTPNDEIVKEVVATTTNLLQQKSVTSLKQTLSKKQKMASGILSGTSTKIAPQIQVTYDKKDRRIAEFFRSWLK